MLTNDKNYWLLSVYEQMKQALVKSILHMDETYAQIILRSDGKSGQSNAYNRVFHSIPSQGPLSFFSKNAL